uniref:Integrase catalytic domain-containing protein n=1 Tax=Fagus sylvatica TaxID=28930 RepID=A0A2N9J551_FAGSY
MSSLPALTNEEEEEQIKPPPTNDLNVTTTVEKEEGQTKPPPTNDLNVSNTTNEDEEQAELPPAKSLDNNTTAKEVQTDPQVEELSNQRHHHGGGFHHTSDPPLPARRGSKDVDQYIVVHKIPLKPGCKPVRQALRRMKPEVILKIKKEVEKQLKAGFLSTVTYSDWITNIVLMPKKDGKVRKCVDYRDLNRASLKDNFPLPHIDTLVDNTATNAVFSFMDGFSGYNQIKMAEEDKLNPNKCAFGVTSRKLLGFIVNGKGIEIDPTKVQAIRSMPAPKTEKEIRSFLGMINYVARFIAQLTATCEPLFKLLRKDVKIKWTEDCQKAFDKIKEYLLSPPILQDETRKKEQAIYYLSKKFTEPETRYMLVEKTCCALAWASKKLRQYMLYYTTWLGVPNGPDQVHLREARLDREDCAVAKFPDEDVMVADEGDHCRWKLYFDGAANVVGSGIGIVLVSPKGQQTPIAVKLGFDCTNNMTEYKACIVDLAHNHFADALATLASLIKLTEGDDVRPLRIETRDILAYCVCVEECMNVEAEVDNKPWYYDIKRFVQSREYPPQTTENEKKYIRRMAFQFFLSGEILYKRTHDATLLRCVDAEEANRLIQEMHEGLMGAHANGPFPARKIMRADRKNAPPQYLHTMASPWPFSTWGMDVIGTITPKALNGHEFILVAIDYFTKWVEACSFKNVTQVTVTWFVKHNIICRYGMPEMLITDNASNLNNRMMDQLCQQFKIQHHNFAPYRPKMNGAVEAANKNVKKILSKMTEMYKDWHEHLPYALCTYQTSVRTSVGATPYSLVYGMEAVLPVEVEIPSLRILSQTQLDEAEAYNKKARPRTFQPRDLVLKKRNTALLDTRGKLAPSYEGPYVVKKAFSEGAIMLADMDGEEFRSPINSDSVIKYHV